MWRPRAFTLVQTLVAVFIMALASTLMTTFLVYGMRQTLRNEQRQELILKAEKAVLRILERYSPSRASYLTYNPSIAGIVFPRASLVNDSKLIFDSDGALIWTSWQAYGWDSRSGTLYEAGRALAAPVTSGGELTTGPLTPPSGWPRRTLATRVREFQVTGPTSGVIRVRLLLRDDQGYQVELASSGAALN